MIALGDDTVGPALRAMHESPGTPWTLATLAHQAGVSRTTLATRFAKLVGMPPHNEDGTGGMHLYTPWWLDNKKLDFPRGYHIEIGGGRRMPGAGFLGNIHAYTGVEASGTPISFGGSSGAPGPSASSGRILSW